MDLTTHFVMIMLAVFCAQEELKQARADHEAGHIDDAALKLWKMQQLRSLSPSRKRLAIT